MANQFKRLLVPLDGSKQSLKALDNALNLASLTDGVITGLHVIPHVPAGGPRTKAYDEQLNQEAKNIIDDAKKLQIKKE